MRVKKLTIFDGIVQDKFICGIPVRTQIIERVGKANVRTEIPVSKPTSVTVHNTANTNPTATDSAHASYFRNLEEADIKYIGAAFFVDHDSITQILPLNEAVFHTSNKVANRTSISVEICENQEYEIAESNAKALIAALMLTYDINDLKTHQEWTGKYCPKRILDRPDGWRHFVSDVIEIHDNSLESETSVQAQIEEAITSYHEEVVVGLVKHIEKLTEEVREFRNIKEELARVLGGQS